MQKALSKDNCFFLYTKNFSQGFSFSKWKVFQYKTRILFQIEEMKLRMSGISYLCFIQQNMNDMSAFGSFFLCLTV